MHTRVSEAQAVLICCRPFALLFMQWPGYVSAVMEDAMPLRQFTSLLLPAPICAAACACYSAALASGDTGARQVVWQGGIKLRSAPCATASLLESLAWCAQVTHTGVQSPSTCAITDPYCYAQVRTSLGQQGWLQLMRCADIGVSAANTSLASLLAGKSYAAACDPGKL